MPDKTTMIAKKIADAIYPEKVINEKQLLNIMDEISLDIKFDDVIDELMNSGISVSFDEEDNQTFNDSDYEYHNTSEKVLESNKKEENKNIKKWIKKEKITYSRINEVLDFIKKRSDIGVAFFLNILHKHFINDVKKEYSNIPDYGEHRLELSRSVVYRYIQVAERFIFIKDSVSIENIQELSNTNSYNVLSDSLGNQFNLSNMIKLLSLNDKLLKRLIEMGILHSGSTGKQIKQIVTMVNEKGKISKVDFSELYGFSNTNDKWELPSLRIGSKGKTVKRLQQILVAEGYNTEELIVNGDFDKATEESIKLYQKTLGLKQTGSCNSETWRSLMM